MTPNEYGDLHLANPGFVVTRAGPQDGNRSTWSGPAVMSIKTERNRENPSETSSIVSRSIKKHWSGLAG